MQIDDVSKVLLLISIIILLLVIIKKCIYKNIKFDEKIIEIENLLNQENPRKNKYILFDLLDQASDYCSNYTELEKLQRLLLRVYNL